MAVIHHTTLVPTKLELLAQWLPTRPWYRGGTPRLSAAGGFRLDDPAGAVGIEFMVVIDAGGDRSVSYLTPMAYRDAPVDGADDALIGTAQHGVLGTRWVYDGPRDPVVAAQLVAAIRGEAQPQAQRISHTADPSVRRFGHRNDLAAPGPVTDGPAGTEIALKDAVLRLNRVLVPGEPTTEAGLVAGWTEDGTVVRGPFAEVAETVR